MGSGVTDLKVSLPKMFKFQVSIFKLSIRMKRVRSFRLGRNLFLFSTRVEAVSGMLELGFSS